MAVEVARTDDVVNVIGRPQRQFVAVDAGGGERAVTLPVVALGVP